MSDQFPDEVTLTADDVLAVALTSSKIFKLHQLEEMLNLQKTMNSFIVCLPLSIPGLILHSKGEKYVLLNKDREDIFVMLPDDNIYFPLKVGQKTDMSAEKRIPYYRESALDLDVLLEKISEKALAENAISADTKEMIYRMIKSP